MEIYLTRDFASFAKKQKLADASLQKAIEQIEAGLIDADLGGGIIKQRVARQGAGKSGGYRTIIAYKRDDKAFFLHGFAKNKQDNISKDQLIDLKDAGQILQNLSTDQITAALQNKKLFKV